MTYLTPREREVLRLMGKGETAKDAARRLGIAPSTVQGHVAHILRKLGVHNIRRAVALVRQ